MATELDAFTARRLARFIEDFRGRGGQLPTFNDLVTGGFSGAQLKVAKKSGLIEELFVKLTNGTVVKGFKWVAR